MKRKTLLDFYSKPQKQKFLHFETCANCHESIYYKHAPYHECHKKPKAPKPLTENIPHAIKQIMSTPQKSYKSNLTLTYKGMQNSKHIWDYQFSEPINQFFVSKKHKLTLGRLDPQSITLTFSTSHTGSRLHFYDCIPIPNFSIGVMKSLLQKSIRRCNRKSAIKTALQFACTYGIQQLARRLCVIPFDDVIVHPDYPLLVWCMGTNDYPYSLEILETILQIVSDLASLQYRDLEFHETCDNYQLFQEAGPLPKCILIRAFYKGMHGDVHNLKNYAKIWHMRNMNQKWVGCFEKIFADLKTVDYSELRGNYIFEDITIEGIDMGCSGLLKFLVSKIDVIKALDEKKIENMEEYLESMMWEQRSGFNPRKYLSDMRGFEEVVEYRKSSSFQKDEFFHMKIIPFADAYSRKQAFQKLQVAA